MKPTTPRRRFPKFTRCRVSHGCSRDRSSAAPSGDAGVLHASCSSCGSPRHIAGRASVPRWVHAFEARARAHACSSFYLETFSFQVPALYRSLGYTVAYEHAPYPHGIVKFVMVKHDRA